MHSAALWGFIGTLAGALIGAVAAIWGGAADRKAASRARKEEREASRLQDREERQRALAERLARELGTLAGCETDLGGAAIAWRFARAHGWPDVYEYSTLCATAMTAYRAAFETARTSSALLDDADLRADVRQLINEVSTQSNVALESMKKLMGKPQVPGEDDEAANATEPSALIPPGPRPYQQHLSDVIDRLGEATRTPTR